MATRLIGFDVGDKRIGLAEGDGQLKIAFPSGHMIVDGLEIERIGQLIAEKEPSVLVVGYPRDQSGGETDQTAKSREFGDSLVQFGIEVVYQDESLTSVIAEDRLKQRGKPYSKADIDSEAAAIILQDFIEANYGH